MAMLPFCGYNMAAYFGHWLAMGSAIPKPPKIFHVNWFRQDDQGRFLWPGFGENLRVLKWILDRCQGRGQAVETPIGCLPAPGAIDLTGLDVPDRAMRDLVTIDRDAWRAESENIGEFFGKFGAQLPGAMTKQRAALAARVG
jgi:phosphoenolpyruvate carboxykinase (GTP)